jgi:glycosyltransferase involved in cell wall biosynthesis
MEQLLYDKKVIIASYTHMVKGKYTTIGGPGLALKDYLKEKVKKLMCIWQPMPISDTLSIIIERYDRNSGPKISKIPIINWPFGRKKTISFIYIVLKLRDIFSVFISYILFWERFDIFIGIEALNALVGVFLRKLGLVKTVIYYNLDYGIKRFPISILNSMFHSLDKMAVVNSDFTWCLSEQMLIERNKKGIVNKKNTPQLVIPIGIDFYRKNRLPFEAIRKKSIVYLGVLEELQGVQLLIEAFAQIVKRIPDISLTIIGSGDFEPNLRQMVKDYELENHVKFTGTISDEEAEKILCHSAIGVAPYLDDPYSNTRFTEPTKPKHYLACGLPVIITRIVKIAFDIDQAKAGIAINYNRLDLIEAINKLLTDDILYKEYRQNAIAFAAKYDWKNIFDSAFRISLA